MKRAPRSRQRHDLYAKYHDYDSEISDLLGECGLATMDVELAHGSNGIDTAIELRERFSIPSLFVSGSLGKEIMEKAAPAEPVGFLNKPISSDDVLRAVERYLGGGDLPNVR